MYYSESRVLIVSQLYRCAEFNEDFLLRVEIRCDIDIKAYLISIGTIHLEFGAATYCNVGLV